MTKFINPAAVVAQTGLMQGQVVADLGCGNGFYVLPAAQMVGPTGSVIAVDVMEQKLAATVSITSQFGYKNVRILRADLSKPLLDIEANSCDMVIVGNILHEISQTEQFIKNIYRVLKSPGRVMVVEWKKTATPFGPPLNKRIDQEKLEVLLMQAGFRKEKELQADGYHYAMLFEK
ncbi:MAG: class I SAM-dependent methyltransferase [Candidatus Doudnabacteria bacterium]|nr:class I SAM-dependent methyltransferase [Candidatus Doudnabacteria bacterium]